MQNSFITTVVAFHGVIIMPNEKTSVDQWVRNEINNLNIPYTEQTSDITVVKNALKHASKQGGTGVGKPEFVFTINKQLIIVEDKPQLSELIRLSDDQKVDLQIPAATAKFAVNGAIHYAKQIVLNTSGDDFSEILAIGVAGNYENHKALIYQVSRDETANVNIKEIGILNDWQQLSPSNFDEWYAVNVLGDLSSSQKDELDLKQFASKMHEDLRNYANIEGENKATVVSAILLALFKNKKLTSNLRGENVPNDGQIIYRTIEDFMESGKILPQEKIRIVMSKFLFIQNNVALNSFNKKLNSTPLHYFSDMLSSVIHHFKKNTEFDILGNFYSEFVKYGGSDGNGLGIVLTPKHITSLMTELISIGRGDYVLDPTAGSGSFLISAMNRMTSQPYDKSTAFSNNHIKQHQLYGVEMQEKMFTVAVTNMILRGDGKSNLKLADIFEINKQDFNTDSNGITKVLMNPPYSQGSTDNPQLYEINFVLHALSLLEKGGKLAALVPQGTMIGKSKSEKIFKKTILNNHTLEAVITLNPQTFQEQRAGTQPVIAIFTAGHPHNPKKQVKFINYKDDGLVVKKHVGLVDDGTVREKRDFLINVFLNDQPASTKFLVKSSITSEDEWLHSYFYFNDSIPTREDFIKTQQDYLSFKFDQIIHGRGYLFSESNKSSKK